MSSICSWCADGIGARIFWLCRPHQQLQEAHQALAAQGRERVQAAYVEGRSEHPDYQPRHARSRIDQMAENIARATGIRHAR